MTRTLMLTALLLGAAGAPAAAQEGPSAVARPAWVVDGVSDTVWALVAAVHSEALRLKTKLR